MDDEKATLPCVCSFCRRDCKGKPHMHPVDQVRDLEFVLCAECIVAMSAEVLMQKIIIAQVEARAKALQN